MCPGIPSASRGGGCLAWRPDPVAQLGAAVRGVGACTSVTLQNKKNGFLTFPADFGTLVFCLCLGENSWI